MPNEYTPIPYEEEEYEIFVTSEEEFKLQTLEDAARYAYALSKTKEEIAQYEEIAQKEIEKWERKIEQVKEWLESVKKPLVDKESFLSSHLRMFHIRQYESAKDDKERKKLTSIKLPYGVTLASRAMQPKLEIINEDVYKNYAKENGYLKPPKEPEVDWARLKKDIIIDEKGRAINKETGETLEDFITVIPQERKFEVK